MYIKKYLFLVGNVKLKQRRGEASEDPWSSSPDSDVSA
jgi:hypothetical protein